MASFSHDFHSESSDAINIVVDVSAKNSIPRPIDPSDPDYPRLLDLKRRLDEAKGKKKRRNVDRGSKRHGK